MKLKIFLIAIIILIFALPVFVMAQEFNPQVGIPGEDSSFKPGENVEVTPSTFAEYVVEIYEWGIRIIIVLAVVMIMIGGFLWMTAGGSSQKVRLAKKRITSAIVGLILALGSYAILNFVNPDLVSFRSLTLAPVKNIDTGTAYQCFKIGHNTENEVFLSLENLGINANPKKEDIEKVEYTLGVDTNWVANCDEEDEFAAIDKIVDFPVTPQSGFDACLLDGVTETKCDYCDNFPAEFLTAYGCRGGAGIRVKLAFDGNDNLTGLKVETANSSSGGASAFFKLHRSFK